MLYITTATGYYQHISSFILHILVLVRRKEGKVHHSNLQLHPPTTTLCPHDEGQD
jgi:hypothetical protein